MFCEKCGKELPADARFCEHCGNPVTREESLLDRAKRQDQAALAEIYEQTSGAVYRVLKVLIKNDEDTVQDLLQDTYVKAFTRLDQLQDESKLLPWLKTIANNSAKDWLKKCKPVLFTAMAGNEGNEETEALSFEENIEADRIDENPELAMDEKEVRRLVMEILNQLPEDQRVVLGMFYYEDMSVKEIASILEVSDNTVKSRLNYGRKKVKELVLDLEKKGTKLYNVAPFTFFVYLLYRLGKSTSVEAAELDTLQTALHTALQRTAAQDIYKNAGHTAQEAAGQTVQNHAENMTSQAATHTASTGASEAASTVHHASQAASAASKAAGAAAGTAARHAGLKVAAVILAGIVGGGGVTYGVVKNADKIPVIQNIAEDNEGPSVKVAEKPEEEESTEETADTEEEKEDTEDAEDTEDKAEAETPKTDEEIYKEFYEEYVRNENLQVIDNNSQLEYHPYEGAYQQDLMLGCHMEDFGGDGRQELLLLRTKEENWEYDVTPPDPEVNRVLVLELYGIEDQEVFQRQTLKMPGSALNEIVSYVKEQIGMERIGTDFYLCRYGMYHGSAGPGSHYNTIVKVTDNELQMTHKLYYVSSGNYAMSGACEVDGTSYFTGNADTDENFINSVIQQYNISAYQDISLPLLFNLNREEITAQEMNDTFVVDNCFTAPEQTAQVEAASQSGQVDNTVYYYTSQINTQEMTIDGNSYGKAVISGVEYNGDNITFDWSYHKVTDANSDEYYQNSSFVPREKTTFQITPETKYYTAELDTSTDQTMYNYYNRDEFLPLKFNGLQLHMKVQNGTILSMYETS